MQHPWDPGLCLSSPLPVCRRCFHLAQDFHYVPPAHSRLSRQKQGHLRLGESWLDLASLLWDGSWETGAGTVLLGTALPCPAVFHSSSQSGRLSGPWCFSLSHTHTLCYCLVLFSFSPSGQTFPPQQLVSQPPSLNPDTTDDVSVFITVTAM